MELPADGVHLWRGSLDLSPAERDRLWSILSADEQARAARYHFARDRDRFVAGRGLLRCLLSRYLPLRPGAIRFEYSPYGKPALSPGQQPAGPPLHFNLSHSQGLGLWGVTRVGRIGVDVEQVHAGPAEERIAERFFSPRETAVLRALPAEAQDQAFFCCWTRKEAFIKALGEGLSFPLDQFDVSLGPDEPAALLQVLTDPAEAARWSLIGVLPGPGFVGAVAVEGGRHETRAWDWPVAA